MNALLKQTFDWIREDWNSNSFRFCVELLAWAMSIGSAVLFALTVPNVPFVFYLCITISGCAIYAWAAWTRKSVGMLANYILLTAIDTVGLIRMLIT